MADREQWSIMRLSRAFVPARIEMAADGRARLVWVLADGPKSMMPKAAPGREIANIILPDGGIVLPPGVVLSGSWTDSILADRPSARHMEDPSFVPVIDLFSPTPRPGRGEYTMTLEDALYNSGFKQPAKREGVAEKHFLDVAETLRRGLPVAPEVLADYPGLVALYGRNINLGRSAAERDRAMAEQDNVADPDVTVSWSPQEGLLIRTRGKDPAIIDAVRSLGRDRIAHFNWSRNLVAYYKPQSVGVSYSTTDIDTVVRGLRKAGLRVAVVRGQTGTLGEANQRRQDHKFWRSDLYAERAERAVEKADERLERATQITRDIPVGAPTQRAERAEARAERMEAKAAEHLDYTQLAASRSVGLAATAAGYDVTAELDRKKAERRADEFATLFVRKIKGITGATDLASRKKDNLSEYRWTWMVRYPSGSGAVAEVVFDGRTIIVRSGAAEDTVLRQDVSHTPVEDVFAMVVEAMPKVSAAETSSEIIDTPRVLVSRLIDYGRRRTKTLSSIISQPYVTSGYNETHGGLRIGSRDYQDWKLFTVVPTGTGMDFRFNYFAKYHPARNHNENPLTQSVTINLAGQSVESAWGILVATMQSMVTGKPVEDFLPKAKRAPKADKAAVRPGRGAVATLPRDAPDAAARERMESARERAQAVVMDAAERKKMIDSSRDDDAEKGLIEAARAYGNELAFYATPPGLADMVAAMAFERGQLAPGAIVLEPSAGMGALVEPLAARGATVTAVETQPARAAYLRSHWEPRGVRVLPEDFLRAEPVPAFDAVVMNPPFSVPGTQFADIDHVLHAMRFLRPGGVLVAIMSPGTPSRTNAKTTRFLAAIEGLSPQWTMADPKQFRMSGTDVPVAILSLQAPGPEEKMVRLNGHRRPSSPSGTRRAVKRAPAKPRRRR